jgi:hypothetical protein
MTASSDRRRAELAVIEEARKVVAYWTQLDAEWLMEYADLTRAVRALDGFALEPATRARAGGPLLTSQNAAAFVDGARAQSIIGRILRELDERGGMTTEELCIALNGRHQTISARIHELWRNGWLRIAGERKTSSRQEASVWQISPEARLALVAGRSDRFNEERDG